VKRIIKRQNILNIRYFYLFLLVDETVAFFVVVVVVVAVEDNPYINEICVSSSPTTI
jgi:hypothetical protein